MFSNSWALFRATLGVLSRDKELVIFPILSGIASFAILITFVGGSWGLGLFEGVVRASNEGGEFNLQSEWPLMAVAFVYYFVNFFAMNYFTAALVGAAHIRLTGGDPTVADGIRMANACLPGIFGYSLIAATVGMLLKILEGRTRNNFIAGLVVSLIGVAWTLVTYLVVPVLVIEKLGAGASVKRSAGLLRQTWGEQVVAAFGFGLLGSLLSLVGIALLVAGGALAVQAGDSGLVIFIAAAAIAVLYWLALGIILSALRGIYTAALYGHATHRNVRGFPPELLSGAFQPR